MRDCRDDVFAGLLGLSLMRNSDRVLDGLRVRSAYGSVVGLGKGAGECCRRVLRERRRTKHNDDES